MLSSCVILSCLMIKFPSVNSRRYCELTLVRPSVDTRSAFPDAKLSVNGCGITTQEIGNKSLKRQRGSGIRSMAYDMD